MGKVIHSESVKAALSQLGWTQGRLAKEIGVSAQSVTNWQKGDGFPRPDKLLKLATTLGLNFNQLVKSTAVQPIVAFRKKGNSKTTEQHLLKALAMGAMLKPLVSFLPTLRALRTKIPSASTNYDKVQNAAEAVREKLGIGKLAELKYEHLISEFKDNDAIIVPVMWGQKQVHENALHILLPEQEVTFIYLNLDTHIEDFKFWMAHELAHVYTPELAGQDIGEDFADAFAGALLFSKELAHVAYSEATRKTNPADIIHVLLHHAHTQKISLYSVYKEVTNYARAANLPELKVADKDIHAIRNSLRGKLISQSLFDPLPPDASAYMAVSHKMFNSDFFPALQRMVLAQNVGAGYIQQLLDVSLKDATALHAELVH